MKSVLRLKEEKDNGKNERNVAECFSKSDFYLTIKSVYKFGLEGCVLTRYLKIIKVIIYQLLIRK